MIMIIDIESHSNVYGQSYAIFYAKLLYMCYVIKYKYYYNFYYSEYTDRAFFIAFLCIITVRK